MAWGQDYYRAHITAMQGNDMLNLYADCGANSESQANAIAEKMLARDYPGAVVVQIETHKLEGNNDRYVDLGAMFDADENIQALLKSDEGKSSSVKPTQSAEDKAYAEMLRNHADQFNAAMNKQRMQKYLPAENFSFDESEPIRARNVASETQIQSQILSDLVGGLATIALIAVFALIIIGATMTILNGGLR